MKSNDETMELRQTPDTYSKNSSLPTCCVKSTDNTLVPGSLVIGNFLTLEI